jgi:hypothetical protein
LTLKGKHALVTGSTSGIGLGIATALAQQGCKLTLNGFGDPLKIKDICNVVIEAGAAGVMHSQAEVYPDNAPMRFSCYLPGPVNNSRAMINFITSLVPPKMRPMRASAKVRATGYSHT